MTNWRKFFARLYTEALPLWEKAGYRSPQSLKARTQKLERILSELREKILEREPIYLDVGCGWGASSEPAIKNGFRVVGVDNVPLAFKFSEKRKTQFVCADATALPFPPSTFDVVGAVEVLQYIAQRTNFFGEVRRVLKLGGFFILIFPSQTSLFWLARAGRTHLKIPPSGQVEKELWRTGFFIYRKDLIPPLYFLTSKLPTQRFFPSLLAKSFVIVAMREV